MPLKWASEYYASSVSVEDLNRLRRYSDEQEEHHRKKTFAEEYREFMKGCDFGN
jgi:putative transposase